MTFQMVFFNGPQMIGFAYWKIVTVGGGSETDNYWFLWFPPCALQQCCNAAMLLAGCHTGLKIDESRIDE